MMRTMRTKFHAVMLSLACLLGVLAVPAEASEAEAILQRFVEDYKSDIMAVSGTFGVKVDDDWWYVVTETAEGGGPHSVELHQGQPPEPTYFFYTDAATLQRLDEGTMNPGTAMVKAFSTDFAPLDADVMEGFQPDETFLRTLLKATFHFWVRGFPEIVRFGPEYTRQTHGGNAVVFYYQEGLRSGWFSINKGEHVNEDPRSQTNPFPSLFIMTSGKGIGRIDGEEIELEAGETMFIPPGVSHEFWTNEDEPMQGVLIMFGEGA